MTDSAEQVRRPWPMYFAWLLVALLWAATLLGMASIGIFILPVAGLATWLVARQPGSSRGWPGLLSVAGLPLLVLSITHRTAQDGILSSNGSTVTGYAQINPWPWLALSVACALASVIVFLLTTRRRA